MNSLQREEAIVLGMLQAIDANSDVTQRRLADHLGVALGLANSYLKRCVRKGLVKIQQAPANRYLYYLTPEGFVEKSRLTADYLKYSLSFYRRASDSLSAALTTSEVQGHKRLGLYGCSELAEIAAIRASEHAVELVCVLDMESRNKHFAGLPVVHSLDHAPELDAWLFTGLTDPVMHLKRLRRLLDGQPVFVPSILGL